MEQGRAGQGRAGLCWGQGDPGELVTMYVCRTVWDAQFSQCREAARPVSTSHAHGSLIAPPESPFARGLVPLENEDSAQRVWNRLAAGAWRSECVSQGVGRVPFGAALLLRSERAGGRQFRFVLFLH